MTYLASVQVKGVFLRDKKKEIFIFMATLCLAHVIVKSIMYIDRYNRGLSIVFYLKKATVEATTVEAQTERWKITKTVPPG